MNKTAFIFPGQGSQYPGMGKELRDEFSAAAETFSQANDILDYDLEKICFSGSKKELKNTVFTQPAVLTVSVAIFRVLIEKNIQPSIVAGHSLGEYSALVACGVISFADALNLVKKRAQYIDEVAGLELGGMAAVLGLDGEQVKEACEKVQEDGFVKPANYNCPGQVVISGEKDALKSASKICSQIGAKRVLPLPVSAPFHSELLKPAAEKLSRDIASVSFRPAEFPVVTNVDAQPRKDPDIIKQLLIKQVVSPVLWQKSIEMILSLDFNTFIEVGPGNVLTGFMRRIERDAKCFNVSDLSSLKETVKAIG